jgi:hypothetical protein
MKRRRTFESDAERIEAKVAALPTYRFCVPTLRGFAPNASAHELRAVCGRLDVDVSACLERGDFAKALATRARLDRACALERVENGGAKALREAAAEWCATAEVCPICTADFREGERVTLLLCGHEFHPACAVRAAQAEFGRTAETPRCCVCRTAIW